MVEIGKFISAHKVENLTEFLTFICRKIYILLMGAIVNGVVSDVMPYRDVGSVSNAIGEAINYNSNKKMGISTRKKNTAGLGTLGATARATLASSLFIADGLTMSAIRYN